MPTCVSFWFCNWKQTVLKNLLFFFLVFFFQGMLLMQWGMLARQMQYTETYLRPQCKKLLFVVANSLWNLVELKWWEVKSILQIVSVSLSCYTLIMSLFKRRQHASRERGSLVINMEGETATSARRTPTSWGKLVLDLYPPGTSVRYIYIWALIQGFSYCVNLEESACKWVTISKEECTELFLFITCRNLTCSYCHVEQVTTESTCSSFSTRCFVQVFFL